MGSFETLILCWVRWHFHSVPTGLKWKVLLFPLQRCLEPTCSCLCSPGISPALKVLPIFASADPSLRGFISYSASLRRRQWNPTPVLLPGNSHGPRSLVDCSPWGREELDTTEWLYFHFSLSCIEEGNGNPLQRPCLENPRDGGAWWAAVCGVAQSRTRLKRLSSSSSSS